ncbi:MAG: peptidoglycan editing factor PgeF [Deltaproteobacteria bacterium]|nr:peptidoglycan editing factor PgeF [Deltaproteobacteria bacterium]MBW2200987.1 peptidoglycan editing factor PgeF [Deltaproteobacteria bacterium]
MILKQKNGISFYQFPNFSGFSDIWHGVFTRNFGHSKGAFRSLNISFGVGDDDINVELNRKTISQCVSGKEIVYLKQVHGTEILTFPQSDRTAEKERERPYVADGMITDIPGKFLLTQVADCQSVLMYDPVRRVVANVHSGWRGSIKNIIGRTIQTMKNKFSCTASHIIAGIGPSLGPCCAEFILYRNEIPSKFWTYKKGADHFDFWSISRDQLCESGVVQKNIYSSNVCTKCNTDAFFSYRGENTTGRFAAVIGLQ